MSAIKYLNEGCHKKQNIKLIIYNYQLTKISDNLVITNGCEV